MRYEEYIPELNYPAQDYRPFGRRKEHFCIDCVDYYQMMFDKGITKRPFPMQFKNKKGKEVIRCRFDRALIKQKFTEDDFNTPEEYETALRVADPVSWAYTEIGWEPRWYQEEILNCTSQFKAVRAGRRVGKTEALTILIMWFAYTNKNFQILVVCPFVSQVEKIFSKIREMIGRSPTLTNSTARTTRGSPQIIELRNGTLIRGFAAGSASGSDQIRGQDADLIVIDEVDYVADADIEVIMAILTSNKHTRVIVSSTPTGLRSRLFEWSTDKDGRWKEFWYVSAEGPAWDDEVEELYKSMYSPGGYAREFLAEFGEELEGVFRSKDIQKCIVDYDMSKCVPDHMNCTYTMGVDWNKNSGTHIVVIERPKQSERVYYKMVAKVIIRKQKFTQITAVKTLLEMDRYWNPDFVYCDAGFGHTQMEMIWKEDEERPGRLYNQRFKAIQMGGKTEIFRPKTKEVIKKETKPFVVYTTASQVERGFVVWPKSEDTAVRVIPDEVAFQEIGVVQQARNFKVTKRSAVGRETFSQEYEHTLTAWMLAVYAHLMEFGDFKKLRHDHYIGTTGPLGQDKKRGLPPEAFDEFGQKLPPGAVKQRMEQLREEWKAEEQRVKEQQETIKSRGEGFGKPSDRGTNTLERDDSGNKGIKILEINPNSGQNTGRPSFSRRELLKRSRRAGRKMDLRGRRF